MLFIKQLFCRHWWKAIGTLTSAYFICSKGEYLKYELKECKLCGKMKIKKLN